MPQASGPRRGRGSPANMPDGTAALSDLLRILKERSTLSYQELAAKTFTSSSTLHRYCTGKSVPPDVGVVTDIAKVCGASPEELRRVIQAWLATDAERRSAAVAPAGRFAVETPPEAAVRTPTTEPPAFPKDLAAKRPWKLAAVISSVLVLLVGLASSSGHPSAVTRNTVADPLWVTGPSWVAAPVPVEREMFGVTTVSDTGEMPAFQIGAVRFWDSNTRWAQLQPRPGEFDWTRLERLVVGAERADLPILFVFGGTPQWAAPTAPKSTYGDGSRAAAPDDLKVWDTFVRELVTRYKGRIEAYELWVLANDHRYFAGSVETMVEMTRRAAQIIRRADPKAIVVCPGMGRLWAEEGRRVLQRFAKLGGYQHCDVASVKLYQRKPSDPPESMLEILDTVDSAMHQADVHPFLWSTGTTYEISLQKPLDEERAINTAVRFYLTGLYGRERNLRRMYFYSWGNTKIPLVLQAEGGAPTKAALAVEELQRWLARTHIRACGHGVALRLPPNVWQCEFIGEGSGSAFIRWTHTGEANTVAPAGAETIRRLDGSATPVRAGDAVRVGERPVLIETSGKGRGTRADPVPSTG